MERKPYGYAYVMCPIDDFSNWFTFEELLNRQSMYYLLNDWNIDNWRIKYILKAKTIEFFRKAKTIALENSLIPSDFDEDDVLFMPCPGNSSYNDDFYFAVVKCGNNGTCVIFSPIKFEYFVNELKAEECEINEG